jgi:hypothetical protein
VELGARVAEALLARAEGAEVLDRLGDDVVVELKVNAASLLCDGGQRLSAGVAAAVGAGVPLTEPTLVTLPFWSTVTSGPVQEQSK